jgi:hypothetical protein
MSPRTTTLRAWRLTRSTPALDARSSPGQHLSRAMDASRSRVVTREVTREAARALAHRYLRVCEGGTSGGHSGGVGSRALGGSAVDDATTILGKGQEGVLRTQGRFLWW